MVRHSTAIRPGVQHGYTYFGVLFMVTLVSLSLTGASAVWQVQQQRQKERLLLFIGQQYVDAIASYYNAAPGGVKRYPKTLEDLLRDPRYPTVKRHLRRLWQDPFALTDDWGIIRTKQGNIAGIYSLSERKPIKQAGFGELMLEHAYASKPRYRDWKFVYIAANDYRLRVNLGKANAQSMTAAYEVNPVEEAGSEQQEISETGEELLSLLRSKSVTQSSQGR